VTGARHARGDGERFSTERSKERWPSQGRAGAEAARLAALVGVEDDFAALYLAHYRRLVRALELAGLSSATAEDVAQEAFARTLARWARVRRGTNPPGYVFRVAFRLSRRRRDAWWTGTDSSAPDVAGEATLRVALRETLAAMPAGRRGCAVLCLVLGMTPEEAGRALGIAASTVRKQVQRARLDLRSSLGADSGEGVGRASGP